MARSPENAKMKDDAAAEIDKPTKVEDSVKLLKGPDGFVYTFTEALAKQGFVEYSGEVDASGFAKE